MTFQESLKALDIEDYGERIFNSNSHGELHHLQQYFSLAETLKNPSYFRKWFEITVKWAEENWQRPESVFQHIDRLFIEFLEDYNKQPKTA